MHFDKYTMRILFGVGLVIPFLTTSRLQILPSNFIYQISKPGGRGPSELTALLASSPIMYDCKANTVVGSKIEDSSVGSSTNDLGYCISVVTCGTGTVPVVLYVPAGTGTTTPCAFDDAHVHNI